VGSEVRVFLVSHAIALREAVAAMLERDPRFDVVGQAATAAQARSRIPATRPQLAVVTRVLPDQPGVELIRELMVRHDWLRVILFSVWVDDALLAAALDAGAVGVQTYDYLDEEGLTEVLIRAAAGQAVVPADAMRRLLLQAAARTEPDPLDELTTTERAISGLV
jgi:DNA-binding NarL/FixJ family response regulator